MTFSSPKGEEFLHPRNGDQALPKSDRQEMLENNPNDYLTITQFQMYQKNIELLFFSQLIGRRATVICLELMIIYIDYPKMVFPFT